MTSGPTPKTFGDPISQLHKLCFAISDRPSKYLGFPFANNDTVGAVDTSTKRQAQSMPQYEVDINESVIWTIVNVGRLLDIFDFRPLKQKQIKWNILFGFLLRT